MPTSPTTRPERKPIHIPRLSYRNSTSIDSSQLSAQVAGVQKSPITQEESRSTESTRGTTSSSENTTNDPSNPLRPTASRGNDRSPNPRAVVSPVTQKKRSLFGGLFVTKEPTALALERLAAQLEAQHGELSPRAIPGVSSSKLPEHVPKVNTKWDGVPEALKEREKLQREKARAAKRQSVNPSVRSRSAEGSRQAHARPGDRPQLRKRNSSSTLSSLDSRGRGGHNGQSQYSSTDEMRLSSKTTSSDRDYIQRSGKAQSAKSQSLRSPSGSSLPAITSFFPNDIPDPPAVPTRYQSERSTHTVSSQRTTSTGRTRYDPVEGLGDATIDVVPEHTSSPAGTPLDRSPVTPSPIGQGAIAHEPSIVPILNRREEAIFVSSGADVLGPPATSTGKRRVQVPRDAFLAGEARPLELPDDEPGPAIIESDLPFRQSPKRSFKAPQLSAHARVQQDLEKRPDSSRARLGLRASMLVRTDQTPWDWRELDRNPDPERSTSPRLNVPVVPKRLSKVLGKVNR